MANTDETVVKMKTTPKVKQGTPKDRKIYEWLAPKVGSRGIKQVEHWLERAVTLVVDADSLNEKIDRLKDNKPSSKPVYDSPMELIEHLMEMEAYKDKLHTMNALLKDVEKRLGQVARQLRPVMPHDTKLKVKVANEVFTLYMYCDDDEIGLSIVSKEPASL